MLRKCIEVVGLRRGGGSCIRNLSGTASDKKFHPSQSNQKLWGGFLFCSEAKNGKVENNVISRQSI